MKRYKLSKVTLIIAFLPILFSFCPPSYAAQTTKTSIYGVVTDAKTGLPIPNATVVIWDLYNTPKPGMGIYFTDSKGEYNVMEPYISVGGTYKVYAYHQNKGNFDYVPSSAVRATITLREKTVNVNFSLTPGASVYLEGDLYYVESPSAAFSLEVSVIDPWTGQSPSGDFLTIYGNTVDAKVLDLASRLVVIPAETYVNLKIKAFFIRTAGWLAEWIFPISFIVDNSGQHFYLQQGNLTKIGVSEYPLRLSKDVVNAYINEISARINEAQSIGFYVADEITSLQEAQSMLFEGIANSNEGKYRESLEKFRESYIIAFQISKNLEIMRNYAIYHVVFLPPFFAVYAAILAFFFFEDRLRKFISTIVAFTVIFVALYWIYPGTPLIIKLNSPLFFGVSAASIAVVLGITFGLPYVWKEPAVEGRTTLRNFAPVIFSMAKRQIRRRRIRGFFTVISIVVLVLAFTSMTSFGTVYGLVGEPLQGTSPANGVLVKRPLGSTFSPMTVYDLQILGELQNLEAISVKVENHPDSAPIAELRSARGFLNVRGVLGVDPINETRFIQVDKIVEPGRGSYLKDSDENSILISMNAARDLDVTVGETIQFRVRGLSNPLHNFTIKGIFNDERFSQLVDLDLKPFIPTTIVGSKVVPCNSTNVIIIHWRKALELQERANFLSKDVGITVPFFAGISRVALLFPSGTNLDQIIWRHVSVFEFKVYVSTGGKVREYKLGETYEIKGAAELAFPLAMVILNVGAVMLNAVYERRHEMRVLVSLGLNPGHIALTFVAEGLVLGLVGGGLGYALGLGFYRIMMFLGSWLMVREKLEWWWSVVGLALAIAAALLPSLRSALLAVKIYTPSAVRKVALPGEERESREEKIFKSFQERSFTMPIRLLGGEAPLFFGYIINNLKYMSVGVNERMEGLEELPEEETPKGDLKKQINFRYVYIREGTVFGTKNSLVSIKRKDEDFHRVNLICAPLSPGLSEKWVDRTVKIIHDMSLDWARTHEHTKS